MTRDSTRSYIHLHSPRHADLFEEFNANPNPQSRTAPPTINQLPSLTQPGNAQASGPANGLPDEDILIPAHLQPLNPEDEDDIVPDQHAAFGITQALAQRERAERPWRDFDGLGGLVRGANLEHKGAGRPAAVGGYAGMGGLGGAAPKGNSRK